MFCGMRVFYKYLVQELTLCKCELSKFITQVEHWKLYTFLFSGYYQIDVILSNVVNMQCYISVRCTI